MKNQRRSNFEMLRIVCMLMIIAAHFASHGDISFDENVLTINRLWLLLLKIGGKLGVNIFVLISGYFLIDAQSVKIGKTFKLLGQVFIYSVAIYAVSVLVGEQQFTIKTLISSLLPLTMETWWFPSTYFVLYLIFPVLNFCLKAMSRQMYRRFLLLSLVIWCLIPTLTNEAYQSNNLIWFVLLYAISAYIKLYGIGERPAKKYALWSAAGLAITYLSAIVFTVMGFKYPIFARNVTHFYGMNKITTLVNAICIFMAFRSLKLKHKPFINTVASATFGVYLIHDHALVRNFLWKRLFTSSFLKDSLLLIPYSIAAILAVFTVCTGIELLRIHTIERLWMRIVGKLEALWLRLSEKIKGKLPDDSDKSKECA